MVESTRTAEVVDYFVIVGKLSITLGELSIRLIGTTGVGGAGLLVIGRVVAWWTCGGGNGGVTWRAMFVLDKKERIRIEKRLERAKRARKVFCRQHFCQQFNGL